MNLGDTHMEEEIIEQNSPNFLYNFMTRISYEQPWACYFTSDFLILWCGSYSTDNSYIKT